MTKPKLISLAVFTFSDPALLYLNSYFKSSSGNPVLQMHTIFFTANILKGVGKNIYSGTVLLKCPVNCNGEQARTIARETANIIQPAGVSLAVVR